MERQSHAIRSAVRLRKDRREQKRRCLSDIGKWQERENTSAGQDLGFTQASFSETAYGSPSQLIRRTVGMISDHMFRIKGIIQIMNAIIRLIDIIVEVIAFCICVNIHS